MLAIKKNESDKKCVPNVLPCRINYNGPVDAGRRYWSPNSTAEGDQTAYFRGRKLVGKTLPLPDGYRGVVVAPTEAPASNAPVTASEVIDLDAEEASEREKAGVMKEQASFEKIVVWGHESSVNEEDIYIRGVEQWINFAGKIHAYDEHSETST